MPNYFTHYWSNDTWSANASNYGVTADHTASNLFRRRGVSPGDEVFIVTVLKGRLYVAACLIVDRVCDAIEAASLLATPLDALWDAKDHIIARMASPLVFDVALSQEMAQQVQFFSGGVKKRLTFKAQDVVDPQTVREVRKLTPESASLLRSLLPPLQHVDLSLRHKAPIRLAEEISPEGSFTEGAVQQIMINAYERNRQARAACIAHWGSSCVVCGFNFANAYGRHVSVSIHVHHLVPLSFLNRAYEVDPVADLRPVCPNCHAVIHSRTGEPYSIEEVKAMIGLLS